MQRLPNSMPKGQEICTVRQWFRANRWHGTFRQEGPLHGLLMALGVMADANDRLKRLSEDQEFSGGFVRAGIALAMMEQDAAAFEAVQLLIRQALSLRAALEEARDRALHTAAKDWLKVVGVDRGNGQLTMRDIEDASEERAREKQRQAARQISIRDFVVRDGITVYLETDPSKVTEYVFRLMVGDFFSGTRPDSR
jgi:hypothetical protein